MRRARDIIFVRLFAAHTLLSQWRRHPPRPSDIARTARQSRDILRESGLRGLVRVFNDSTHQLAKKSDPGSFLALLYRLSAGG